LCDVRMMDCEYVSNFIDDVVLCTSLPYFCYCVFLLCGTLICDDHQLVGVSRDEEHPWTTGRW